VEEEEEEYEEEEEEVDMERTWLCLFVCKYFSVIWEQLSEFGFSGYFFRYKTYTFLTVVRI
jgi:hypothetical protein